MIKKMLYFSSPANLKCRYEQLQIYNRNELVQSIPIEDIGYLIIDNYGVTLTHGVLHRLLDNNVCIVTTDDTHMPKGIFLNLDGNSEQTERFRLQVDCGTPLKKQLWRQTIRAKIRNQYLLLKSQNIDCQYVKNLIPKVLSDDSSNREAVASKYYWKFLFEPDPFRRHRDGKPPNNLLNYGYAVLRAVIARALVASGLLPCFGIHHHNRYNSFPLADDIMEPYRPFVDNLVVQIVNEEYDISRITPEIKKSLLETPMLQVKLHSDKMPLFLAASRTTASLVKCFQGLSKKIIYPELCV